MLVSVRANVRTAAHARKGDLGATMRYAFRGGSVTGMSVAGLALLELVGFYAAFGGNVLSMVGRPVRGLIDEPLRPGRRRDLHERGRRRRGPGREGRGGHP